jgi:hypothetical protein
MDDLRGIAEEGGFRLEAGSEEQPPPAVAGY